MKSTTNDRLKSFQSTISRIYLYVHDDVCERYLCHFSYYYYCLTMARRRASRRNRFWPKNNINFVFENNFDNYIRIQFSSFRVIIVDYYNEKKC